MYANKKFGTNIHSAIGNVENFGAYVSGQGSFIA